MAPPRRVLLAWELGGGYGHIHLMLPLADRLAAEGAAVSLAMSDPATGRALIGDRQHPVLPAPMPPAPGAPLRIESWADLPVAAGYTDAATVGRLIAAWGALLRDHRIDLVVAEFAPAVMLAARLAGIPAMPVGMGWNIPPATTPLPAIRFWDRPGPDALAAAESRLLGTVNPALVAAGGAPLPNLATLFDPALCCLCSFPELDHYPARGDAAYFGAIYQTGEGVPPLWPTAGGPRCFAYVNGAHPVLPALLEGLGRAGLATAMHLRGGLPPGRGAPRQVWIAPGPVRMDQALAERPVVICQGLHSMAAALAAGCPVLSVPEHLEQTVLANRLTAQGLGLALQPQATAAEAAATLRRLVDDPAYRRQAEAFAGRYAGYAPAMAVEAVIGECLDLLG